MKYFECTHMRSSGILGSESRFNAMPCQIPPSLDRLFSTGCSGPALCQKGHFSDCPHINRIWSLQFCQAVPAEPRLGNLLQGDPRQSLDGVQNQPWSQIERGRIMTFLLRSEKIRYFEAETFLQEIGRVLDDIAFSALCIPAALLLRYKPLCRPY